MDAARRTWGLATRPVALIAALLAPSVVWIALDRSIWAWDRSWYGRSSLELWATARLEPGRWLSAMQHAQHVRAPGIAWLGQLFVPLAEVVGNVHVALLLSVVACLAAALGLVHGAALRLAEGRRGVATVALLVTATAPLFVSLSREYLVESLQTLAVAWVVFVAASASRWRPALTVAQLVAAFSLALLAKVATPLYMAAPGVAALTIAALRRERVEPRPGRDLRLPGSIALAGALCFGTVSWYASNGDAAFHLARVAARDRLHGSPDPFFTKLWSLLRGLEGAVFVPWFSLLLIPLAAAAAVAVRRRQALRPAALICYASCLAAVAIFLTILSFQVNSDIRFLLPLLPATAVVLAGAVDLAGSSVVAGIAIVALVCQFALVTAQSFASVRFRNLAYLTIRPPAKPRFARELRLLVGRTCDAQAEGRTTIVGVDYPWLSADTLGMLASERLAPAARRCRYATLGTGESDPEAAWRRVEGGQPPYYVSIDYDNPRNPLPPGLAEGSPVTAPFNQVDRAVFARVAHDMRFTPVPESRRSGVVVFRSCFRPIRPFVRHLVGAALRRPARLRELARWSTELNRARAGGIDTAVAAAGRVTAAVFESRAYARLHTSDDQYVRDLYSGVLERSPEPVDVDGWVGQLQAGVDRSAIREAFVTGPEFRGHVRLFCAG